MSQERIFDEIVTKFLLNTCRLRPQLTRHALQAAVHCATLATAHPPDDDDTEADAIPLTTGSAAEFYIEPMLPHVGDVDVMYHHRTELAIPRGHPPPTQLPAEFSDYVRSETWPVRKENVMALQRAEMRMVRWMCGCLLYTSPSPRD